MTVMVAGVVELLDLIIGASSLPNIQKNFGIFGGETQTTKTGGLLSTLILPEDSWALQGHLGTPPDPRCPQGKILSPPMSTGSPLGIGSSLGSKGRAYLGIFIPYGKSLL